MLVWASVCIPATKRATQVRACCMQLPWASARPCDARSRLPPVLRRGAGEDGQLGTATKGRVSTYDYYKSTIPVSVAGSIPFYSASAGGTFTCGVSPKAAPPPSPAPAAPAPAQAGTSPPASPAPAPAPAGGLPASSPPASSPQAAPPAPASSSSVPVGAIVGAVAGVAGEVLLARLCWGCLQPVVWPYSSAQSRRAC